MSNIRTLTLMLVSLNLNVSSFAFGTDQSKHAKMHIIRPVQDQVVRPTETRPVLIRYRTANDDLAFYLVFSNKSCSQEVEWSEVELRDLQGKEIPEVNGISAAFCHGILTWIRGFGPFTEFKTKSLDQI